MNLKKWRVRRKISAAAFARRAQISYASLRRYELGERSPSLAVVMRIARLTGGDVRIEDWLMMASKTKKGNK